MNGGDGSERLRVSEDNVDALGTPKAFALSQRTSHRSFLYHFNAGNDGHR